MMFMGSLSTRAGLTTARFSLHPPNSLEFSSRSWILVRLEVLSWIHILHSTMFNRLIVDICQKEYCWCQCFHLRQYIYHQHWHLSTFITNIFKHNWQWIAIIALFWWVKFTRDDRSIPSYQCNRLIFIRPQGPTRTSFNEQNVLKRNLYEYHAHAFMYIG